MSSPQTTSAGVQHTLSWIWGFVNGSIQSLHLAGWEVPNRKNCSLIKLQKRWAPLPTDYTNGVIDCLSGLFNPAALWIHADKAGFPMSAAVGGRDDYDASPLRGLARTSEDLRQARRLLSLACVHDGMSRADATKMGGMAR